MPIFEFICESCEESFEELLRFGSNSEQIICPECGSEQVRKLISTFATKFSGGQNVSRYGSTSSCNSGST